MVEAKSIPAALVVSTGVDVCSAADVVTGTGDVFEVLEREMGEEGEAAVEELGAALGLELDDPEPEVSAEPPTVKSTQDS